MGRYRVPSPTPSVGSDAPIPETLQEEDPVQPQIPLVVETKRLSPALSEVEQTVAVRPKMELSDTTPVDDNGAWVFFVGNLHPCTTQTELYDLFKTEGGESIRNIVIRSARGCSVTVIPDEAMTSSDRCYASVEVKGFGATWRALNKYDSEDPPMLHGFPLVVKLSVADMPEVSEIMGRTMKSLLGTKSKRRTKRRAPKRLAIQKTESVIGGQQKSLVGPSRRIAKPKRRPNPTGGAR